MARAKEVKEEVNAQIGRDLKEIEDYVPGGAWGEVKTILSVLRGNGVFQISESFKRGLKAGDVGYPHFYIDARVNLDPVKTDYWGGSHFSRADYGAGRRELDKAHASLKMILDERRDIVARFREQVKAGKKDLAQRIILQMTGKQAKQAESYLKRYANGAKTKG